MSDLSLLQLIILTFIYPRTIFTWPNRKCDIALWIHERAKPVSSPSSTEPCTLSCLCHCGLHNYPFSHQHLFTAVFQWTHISQNMLQMLFKFRFSFHPNLQYPPMQKSESPDASCNTENARNMLRCLSTHFNSLSLPHTEKCKHFTFVKKVLKTQSLPKTSPPCGGCGQTPLLQTMEKVTVSPDFPQEPAHVWIYKVSFPLLHLGWGSRSVSLRCSAGKWAPRLWPGWMARHGARLEAGQSPWISTWIQG